MKNKILLTALFFCIAMVGFGQEPEVKIIAMPNNLTYDQILLKNGTTLAKARITQLIPGEKLVVINKRRNATYTWSEIQQIGLSRVSLQSFSANWGSQHPVTCDSLALKDKVTQVGKQALEGTLYEFNPFYQVKIQIGPMSYKTIAWDKIESITLAKASPFTAYATDEACRSGNAPERNKEKTNLAMGKDGALTLNYEKELSTEQLRKAWAIRGGALFSKEYNVALSMVSASSSQFDMKGFGYGMHGALNLVNLSPPIYPDKPSSLITRLGGNAGFNMYFLSIDMPSQAGMKIEVSSATQSTIVMGLNIGLQQSFGKFSDSKTWNGLALGIAWRPTYQYSKYSFQTKSTMQVMGKTYTNYSTMSDSNSDLNMTGFEFYVDFVNLNAITNRFAKPAHFKFNVFFLPPMGDMNMMFVQFGFGMVTY